MDRESLITAAEELNIVLNLTPQIDTGENITDKDLIIQIRKASLWMYESDPISEDVIKVLKSFRWRASDFKNLEDPKDQNPLPAFIKHGIWKVRKSSVEESSTVEESKEESKTSELDEIDEETAPEFTDTNPKHQPKKPIISAYGTALALMGPDPSLPIHKLYDMMKERGFDLQSSTGSIKTAHSIFRKVYRYLKENGHIKEK